MGYTLFAVIAQPHLLEADPSWIANSKIIQLEQGLRMLPVTDSLYDNLVQQHIPIPGEDWAGFIRSPGPLFESIQKLSERGTVAYVEADFFGGRGDQRCVVWHKEVLVLGPLDEPGAINKALRRLGVRKRVFIDEFDTIGLSKHRSNEEWLESARDAEIKD